MQKGKKRNPFKFILVLLVFLAGFYLVGFFYAGSFFLPRTYINNTKVSFMSAESANDALIGEGPKLTVIQRSNEGNDLIKETIDILGGGFGDLSYDTERLINNQDRLKWFLNLFNKKEINNLEVQGEFSNSSLKSAVANLYFMKKENIVEPKNASLKSEAGRITIIPEVEGTKADKDKAYALIEEAAQKALNGDGDQTVDLEKTYITPEIRANSSGLQKAQDELGKIASKSIDIFIRDDNGKTITGAEIIDLITIDGYYFTPNKEKIAEFVKDLSSVYYVSKYEYVIEEDLTESIASVLLEENSQRVSANWYINYPTPGSRGNGSPSFIEVSIGKQHMWYYEYGEEILSCDVVTGNPLNEEEEFRTPTGYFDIVYKIPDTHLIGEDYDVEVKYWMGFEYSGYYGFHDAPWRGEFGKNIYTYSPSHGCVNLPEDIAAELFERVAVEETEVYIYDIPEDHIWDEELEEESEDPEGESGEDESIQTHDASEGEAVDSEGESIEDNTGEYTEEESQDSTSSETVEETANEESQESTPDEAYEETTEEESSGE